MRHRITVITAALICFAGCVETNFEVGGNLVPDNQKYTMVTGLEVPLDVRMEQTDSLSGFSSNWITVGAIRDEELGLTTRASALYLMPINDTLIFGSDPKVKRLHLSVALDSVSVSKESQRNILQSVNVYPLAGTIDPKYTYDCNCDVSTLVDWSRKISRNTPIINGVDSLSFDFTPEYAEQFLSLTQEDLKDIKTYKKKIKGFYLCTDAPSDCSGRINMFQLQLGYNTEYYFLTGNYARLDINASFDGERKDTSYFFYLSPSDMYNVDSLLVNTSQGNLPQYAFNISTRDKAKYEELSLDKTRMCVEGGGGAKPHIMAKSLRDGVRELIKARGHDPKKVILTKASLTFKYDAPDEKYEGLRLFPAMLSPTVRMHGTDTSGGVSTRKVVYDGLSDSSSSTENQGDINYSLQQYAPDITYHLQELINMEDSLLVNGDYDIWLLTMAYRTTVVVDENAAQMSDYYSALAYQQYYNNMYGGYGGYGGYGYGGYGYGYGYDPYSNYYSYMMAAMYAGNSSSTTSTTLELDKDRFYKAFLCGTEHPDESRRPKLVFSYAVPNR